MKNWLRAVYILFGASLVFIVLGILTVSSLPIKLQAVDAVSVDSFLATRQALYESLYERIATTPEGVVRTNPPQEFPNMVPKFQNWPPENHIRLASQGTYTYTTECRFELDLERASFPVEMHDGMRAAHTLLDYYLAPVLALGFENPGPGLMGGNTQLLFGTWTRPNDPTIEVVARVFVAPESKDAIVWLEIHERLSK
jgi:hypothetical protein